MHEVKSYFIQVSPRRLLFIRYIDTIFGFQHIGIDYRLSTHPYIEYLTCTAKTS